MTQLYLRCFEYRAATKSEFDQAWTIALQTFARTGNWGGAEVNIRHIKTYGTAWGLCIDRGRGRRRLWPLPTAPCDELRSYSGRPPSRPCSISMPRWRSASVR